MVVHARKINHYCFMVVKARKRINCWISWFMVVKPPMWSIGAMQPVGVLLLERGRRQWCRVLPLPLAQRRRRTPPHDSAWLSRRHAAQLMTQKCPHANQHTPSCAGPGWNRFHKDIHDSGVTELVWICASIKYKMSSKRQHFRSCHPIKTCLGGYKLWRCQRCYQLWIQSIASL